MLLFTCLLAGVYSEIRAVSDWNKLGRTGFLFSGFFFWFRKSIDGAVTYYEKCFKKGKLSEDFLRDRKIQIDEFFEKKIQQLKKNEIELRKMSK